MLDLLKEIVESMLDPSAGGTVGLEAQAEQDEEEWHCACHWGAKETMQKKG